jgi:hypothetical protein
MRSQERNSQVVKFACARYRCMGIREKTKREKKTERIRLKTGRKC